MRIDELLVHERLPASFRAIIEATYAPLAQRIAQWQAGARRCISVGLCGSQGSGKSTVSLVLKTLLNERGIATEALSLDDLYLPRSARLALSEQVHPLLLTRGVPGTHDVTLGLQALTALRGAGAVRIPAFDKALDDRRPIQQWRTVEAPVQVVLFEGWCVGAMPQSHTALAEPINELERERDASGDWRRYVNAALAGEYRQLFATLDALVLLQAPSFEVVYGWRLEQERKLRERVQADSSAAVHVMSDSQVENFIRHYERLTRHILAEMPARADVVVRLAADRTPFQVDYRER